MSADGRSRRRFLRATGGTLSLLALPAVARGAARSTIEDLLDDRFGARADHALAPQLELARIVENGNSVAVELSRSRASTDGRLHLLLPRNPEPWALSARFGALAEPRCATRVRLSSTQNAVAVDERADGALARAEVPVLVTLGACIDENFEDWVRVAPGRPQTASALARAASDDAEDGAPGAGFSGVRLGAPASVTQGDAVDVRLLLRHPMETGYRIDTRGERVRRNIVERLRVSFDGELVAELELGPAVSADPYFGFRFTPPRSGELLLEAREDRGDTLREQRTIEVRRA